MYVLIYSLPSRAFRLAAELLKQALKIILVKK
jgi:hypothetical protein